MKVSRRELLAGSAGLGIGLGLANAAEVITGPNEVATTENSQLGYGENGKHEIYWSGPPDSNRLALTFDDGPDPEFTERVLDILRTYNILATFFVVGSRVEDNPSLLREVVASGHEVGNHTWGHPVLLDHNLNEVHKELERTENAVRAAVGEIALRFFRPPKGMTPASAIKAAQERGYTTVVWSIDRGSAEERDSAKVADYLMQTITGGSIVCLHDGLGKAGFDRNSGMAKRLATRRNTEIAALPSIIEGLLDRGLKPTTVSDLIH